MKIGCLFIKQVFKVQLAIKGWISVRDISYCMRVRIVFIVLNYVQRCNFLSQKWWGQAPKMIYLDNVTPFGRVLF